LVGAYQSLFESGAWRRGYDRFWSLSVQPLLVKPVIITATLCNNDGFAVGGPIHDTVVSLVQSEMSQVYDFLSTNFEISHVSGLVTGCSQECKPLAVGSRIRIANAKSSPTG